MRPAPRSASRSEQAPLGHLPCGAAGVSDHVDTVVVGAGVVGLAIARQLARCGSEVLVIDAAADFGTETSSRNSEVVHAGIYYPAGSLKAAFCVRGRELLYAYCRAHGIAVKQTGKLIVATRPEEEEKLQVIAAQAKTNGVFDLEMLSRAEALTLEPAVNCTAAVLSPSTGIVDSRAFMVTLLGEAEAHGTNLALRTTFVSAAVQQGLWRLALQTEDGETFSLGCRQLVNAAGNGAHGVAVNVEGIVARDLPPRFMAKGSYCSVSGATPFQRLVYPVPVPGALGIHATLDMQGRVRLGPDIRWVEEMEYGTAEVNVEAFRSACLPYWPGLRNREVLPAYCGIRPKIHGPGEAAADFRIEGPAHHGLANLVNLFGIESPGLTSSMAIAEHVVGLLQK
ncbi:MAG: NAD(P)/FAD-dependent oxidoreductase [Phyllobacteriaceae bacterium]|nr:NAD(P)/FAD-dependent oxidoreductase [Phyllobacteriaceae bacterium]